MRVLFTTKLLQDRAFHPYTLYVLSAVCRKAGHETDLVDGRSLDHIRKKIRASRPDVLAVSTVSARWPFFRQALNEIKREFGIPVIVGGAHSTSSPSIVLEPGVDAACVMEGELALPAFLECLEKGRDFSDIPNLAVKDSKSPNGYRVNALLPFIRDLDSLPFPHFELTDNYPPSNHMPVRIMITSRGCVNACTFCGHSCYRRLFSDVRGYYRRPSVDRVIEELVFLTGRYSIEFFAFFDDVFCTDALWELEFADKYREKIGIPFSCHMINGLVRENSVMALKEAGLRWVGISLESGTQKTLTNVLGRNYSIDDFIESIRILNDAGIGNYVGNILALPGSTLESDLETLEVNRRAKVGFANASIFIPMPGTILGDSVRHKHLFDIDQFDSRSHSTDPSIHEPVILDVPHKKVVRRLHSLFEVAADYTWVYRHIHFLVRLPLLPLYLMIWKAYDARKKQKYLFGAVRLSWRLKLLMAYYTLLH